MSKKGTNDQQHIIDALEAKDYDLVWEKVKYIGYKHISSMEDRYIIFFSIVEKFDTEKNNNFICWYKNYLKYANGYDFKGNRLTSNRHIHHILINEYISPTDDCGNSNIAKKLKDWQN